MPPFLQKYEHYFKQLSDVRVVGQVVFMVIVLLISWSGVKIIHTNYQLQQDIVRLQQENEVQKLKNQNQKLRNEYYNSPQYLELSARQNFGLAAPGEKELLVPKAVALAHVPLESEETTQNETEDKMPTYQKNLQAWMNFFLHRTSIAD